MREFIALPVNQPIGEFFICTIPYEVLEKVAIPDALTLTDSGEHLDGYYKLSGNQREEIIGRRKDIGNFISSVEATFPNTIILAANVLEDGTILPDENKDRWRVEFDDNCKLYRLIIPKDIPISRIIDGQHRVRGFKYAPERPKQFDLPCAVFLDLSMPEQASIFATININQKRVDRSLAYNLFAYNLEDEQKEAWAPDKLSVFFTRRLSVEKGSPLEGHIKVIARQGKSVYKSDEWHVSTSVIVDGICALFSKNPATDRNLLNMVVKEERSRLNVLKGTNDNSPLRSFYLENNDLLIYKLIYNYFEVVNEVIFSQSEKRGFMTKTIGIQALFDFLKELSYISVEQKDISKDFFYKYFTVFEGVDFRTERLQQASGQGRKIIRNFLFYANSLETRRDFSNEDKQLFDELLAK